MRLRTGITPADIIFPLVTLFLIFLCAGMLLHRMFASGGSGETAEVGKIYYKDRVAERKFARQALWSGLVNGAPVYNYDTIRTENLAEAVIELKDGTRIEMDQNTMIVIVFRDDATEINFAGGGIRTVRERSATGSGFSIKSDQGVVDLSEGDIALSQTGDEDLMVTLKAGEASVLADGRSEALGENQQAQVGAERLDLRNLIGLEAPAANARVFSRGDAVAFAWNSASGPVDFEIARDRAFAQGVQRRSVTGRTASVTLPAGLYYWRVSQSQAGGERRFSETRRLTVVRPRPLRLYAPLDGRSFAVPADVAPVNFAWERNRFASAYRILLGQTPDLGDAREIDTLTTTLVERLKPGEYYWKVVTRSLQPDAVTESPIYRFSVSGSAELAAPRALAPRESEELNRSVVDQKGVTFNWLADRALSEFQLQVSKDREFQNVVVDQETHGNFLRLKPGLEPGAYYWRVRASATAFSDVRRFVIGEATRIALMEPEAGAIIDRATATRPGVTFSWRRAGFAGNYRVSIGADAELTQNLRSETTGRPGTHVAGLEPGKYFWRVELLDPAGQVVTGSDVRSFDVGRMLAAPVPTFPRQGALVDMTERESLDFAWEAVPGARAYELELVRLEQGEGSGRTLTAADTASTRHSFRQLGELREGLYEWRVSAVASGADGASRSRTVATRFRVRLPRLDKPQFVSPQDEYYLPRPEQP